MPERTRNQQALLHRLIRAYSAASGIPFDLAKMRLKYESGPWVEVPLERDRLAHFMAHPPYPGDYLELGRGRMHEGEVVPVLAYIKSEASYTKDEETTLIEYVIAQCIAVDADIEFMEGM
jgi:hypothetical protein